MVGDSRLNAATAPMLTEDDSLWRQLKTRQAARPGQTSGFLLVFDQFEELFTYPPAQVEEFAGQLAELLFSTIPARYREALDKTLATNPNAFTSSALNQLTEPFTLRVLMAIRSDRMSLLNRLTAYLPNILKNCFELGALDRLSAEEAILAPAYRAGAQYTSPQFEYNAHLGKYVLREVSILETVTIVTEGVVPVENEEAPLKSTGERIARSRIKTFSLPVLERKRLDEQAAERLLREQEAAALAATDTDGDGVPDKADKCPSEKGVAENNGCPPPVAPTTSQKVPADRAAILAEISNNMVSVKGGTFNMGCQDGRDKDCDNDEKPAHTVTLSGFQISRYEVTQSQWEAVMGENPSNFEGCPDCPVEQLSWNDVQEFLKKLNGLTGQHYRLPTEAEWEYAARGGANSKAYPYNGGNEAGSVAWYNDNSGDKTHPVGKKKANEPVLYDMSGNVLEWCADWYNDYSDKAQTNPKGPASGSYRVLRGGSWFNYPQDVRAAFRVNDAPDDRYDGTGFRLARTL